MATKTNLSEILGQISWDAEFLESNYDELEGEIQESNHIELGPSPKELALAQEYVKIYVDIFLRIIKKCMENENEVFAEQKRFGWTKKNEKLPFPVEYIKSFDSYGLLGIKFFRQFIITEASKLEAIEIGKSYQVRLYRDELFYHKGPNEKTKQLYEITAHQTYYRDAELIFPTQIIPVFEMDILNSKNALRISHEIIDELKYKVKTRAFKEGKSKNDIIREVYYKCSGNAKKFKELLKKEFPREYIKQIKKEETRQKEKYKALIKKAREREASPEEIKIYIQGKYDKDLSEELKESFQAAEEINEKGERCVYHKEEFYIPIFNRCEDSIKRYNRKLKKQS